MHLTRSMKLKEIKKNVLTKKKKKKNLNTVVFIKRGEEETLQGVEI